VKKLLVILLFAFLSLNVFADGDSHSYRMATDNARYVVSVDDIAGVQLDPRNLSCVEIFFKYNSKQMFLQFRTNREALAFLREISDKMQTLKYSTPDDRANR
jgi:hypothetical protein